MQDHHENMAHLSSLYTKMERTTKSPCGLEPDTDASKWLLDETEALNRMRMRTVRDQEWKPMIQPKRKATEHRLSNSRLAINTNVPQLVNPPLSAYPASPLTADTNGNGVAVGRPRAESASSQLLEGGFEIVDDPHEDDDGVVEDKNRKYSLFNLPNAVCIFDFDANPKLHRQDHDQSSTRRHGTATLQHLAHRGLGSL